MNDNIQHEYEIIFEALQSKIIQCWTYISKNWSEELFMNQLDKWENIQKSIFSKVSTINNIPSHLLDKTCKTCRTIWSDKDYLYRQCIKLENIFNLEFIDYISITDVCPNCDSFMNPFLSNPINEEYVRRYIPKKFHKYILISSHKSYEIGYYKGKLDGIDKAIKDSYKINISSEDSLDENHTNLEKYSYLDGYKQGFEEHYVKTHDLHNLFMYELKERIKERKSDFNDDYYIVENFKELGKFEELGELEELKKLEQNEYYSSENDGDDNDWLMVE